MIIGLGTDIIEIARIRNAIKKKAFIEKIFTEKERFFAESTNRTAEVYAGCFSAKEAVSKAFGTGISGFSLKDIEILHKDTGAPYVVLHSNACKIANVLGLKHIFISISHDKSYCVSTCVIEG